MLVFFYINIFSRMNLGFIGTGEITKSVVLGILNSKIKFKRFIYQKEIKNFIISKKKNKKIQVISDNQEIINKSNWIF